MIWSKEDVYDAQIAPLMDQVIKICMEHKIPLAAQFQYEETEDQGPGFVTTLLTYDEVESPQIARIGQIMKPRNQALLVTLEANKVTLEAKKV